MKSGTIFGVLAALSTLGLVGATPANAVPITYTLSGLLDGDYNGDPIVAAPFTIVGIGDTDNLTTITALNLPAVPLTTLTISITGFPVATATTPSYMAHFPFTDTLGFGDSTGAEGFSFDAAGAEFWDLVSNFALNTATFQGAGNPTLTTEGPVSITGISSGQFEAVVGGAVAPEPGTLALLGLGLAATRVRRRRG